MIEDETDALQALLQDMRALSIRLQGIEARLTAAAARHAKQRGASVRADRVSPPESERSGRHPQSRSAHRPAL